MRLSRRTRKRLPVVAFGCAAAAAIAVLISLPPAPQIDGDRNDRLASNQPALAQPVAVAPAHSAPESLAKCDALASYPDDPTRFAAPVPDSAFAPGLAIEACEAASKLNPTVPRAAFQLGRSYWAASRDKEAFGYFAKAAAAGDAVAMKFLGDAYFDGRGLPDGETQNIPTAKHWYEQAINAGYASAETQLADAQKQIDRNTFDASLFQNPSYMQRVYDQNFKNIEYPLSFVNYLRGMVSSIDSEPALFIDTTCRDQITKIGTDLINNSKWLAYFAGLATTDSKGSWTPEGLIKLLMSNATENHMLEQGSRDATVLFNKDGRYGCSSPVTQRIISNIMVTYRPFQGQVANAN